MFRPNSDMFRGIFVLPGQNQNESLHKTDCQIVARKSVVPSSGNFRRQPALRYICGQDQEVWRTIVLVKYLLHSFRGSSRTSASV